jgi:hypothetical protein
MAAVAIAAKKLGLPLRTTMNFNANLQTVGKRPAYLCNYKAGVDANGKPVALQLQVYLLLLSFTNRECVVLNRIGKEIGKYRHFSKTINHVFFFFFC